MSAEKATGPCNKFQPNIFNKSKCQNCFKSREVHLLNDSDMEQAKPIYAGWLCLAPVGTDFENPMQRSRKWQRRFFILYEHGSLSYALDELRSTLPQGTVNMNLCTDITDAEPRTGQKNALCIINPTQEIFIRGDNKETINGWNEQLAVYLQTNKQNQKKKRKVEPVANQEPSPAKMAATDQSCPPSQGDVADCGQRQEEQRAGGPDVTPVWTVTSTDHPGSEWTPAGSTPSYLCPVSRGSLTSDGAGHFGSSASSPDLSAAGRNTNAGFDNQLTESANVETASNSQNQRQHRSSADQPLGLEAARKEHQDGKDVCRQGRTESRTSKQESQQSKEHRDQLRAPLHQRRAKSLDRRTSDTVITPDLLNFKKGWMMKLDEKDQWRKYWFVLSTDSLRYYKDSVAEEASVLEGEIDLTKCYNASEYQVQRNYGFQIHTLKGIFTLSAMTAGIRKNWIQALMKNVHPANAPDVASLPGHHIPCSPPEAIPKPDVTQDSTFKDIATEKDRHSKSRNVTERRQEGHYKTFDWAEFRTRGVDTELPAGKPLSPLELGDLERRRRREERRRRYESMLGISLGRGETQKTEDGGTRALSPKSHQRRKEEIEECWRKVEKTVFIPERTVLLCAEVKDTSEAEKLLHGYRKVVEELKVQLAESERRRLKLEERISTNEFYQQQLDLPLSSEAVFFPAEMNEKQLRDLKDLYKEPRELFLQQQVVGPHIQEHLKASSSAPQLPSIWLHDTEDRLQELSDLPPETAATLSAKPASNSQNETSQVDGQVMGLNFKGTTTHHLNHLDREDCQMFPTSNTMNDRDDSTLTHVAPDQSLVRRLSQEVEVLTRQNQALNQRNQEMINQLTEADREIERLKMELSSKFAESHLRPEVELQEKVTLEDLERQLSMRNQELLDAQMLIASLQESLSETEALLQLKGAEGTEVSGEDESKKSAETEERRLLHCLKATETKLMEVEKQVERSELTCRQLEQQNTELNVALKLYLQRAAEAEADLRRLKEELEKERLKQEPNRSFSGEEKIQQVIEGMVTRLRTLEKLLEVTDRFDFVEETEKEEGSPDVVRQLRWEEEFWKSLLNKLKDDPSQLQDPVGVLVSKATECMMLERQILLEGHSLLLHTGEPRESGKEMCESKASKEMDLILNNESVTAPDTTKVEENCVFAFNKHLCGIEHLKVFTRTKITLLNQISSSIGASAHDKLLLTADRLYDLYFSQHPWSVSFIYFTATEALYCFVYSRLLSRYERGLCCSCVSLKDENQELKAKLSALYEERSLSFGAQVSTCCQTDESYHQDSDSELQSTGGRSVGDVLEDVTESENSEMETPLIRETKISEKHFEESEEEDSNMETQQVSDLTAKVKELEERLSVSTDEMKEEFDEKMSSVQQQHEKEVEKLKATCECGLTAMEECHLKVVEELQRRHQQEVERLLVERDRLLEEESAATATAIEAIKNAHHVELQTEIQRRCQSENSNGNTQLEEIHQQHRAELASCQRELDVLSQQFSLKCLEIKHLVQALDAERKALCLCQQENQDLRSRNQELSGHLAAEITRLCSMAKQDALPLSQGMDMYEMEITLRVKESEVQCLKQEITSLKDKLQTVVKDQRNAAKLYKDVSAELHVVRGKAERDADELREKLRLAYQALNQTLP